MVRSCSVFGVLVLLGLPSVAVEICSLLGFLIRDTVICAVEKLVSRGIVMYGDVLFSSGLGGVAGGVVSFSWYGFR